MSAQLVRASIDLTDEEKKTCIALLTYLKEAFDPSFRIDFWINDKIRRLALENPQTPMPVTTYVAEALRFVVTKLKIPIVIVNPSNMVSWEMVNYVFNKSSMFFEF